MAAVSVPDELDRIIRDALAGPPQSSTRLRPLDRRLAELLGLDPEKVRAKVVDDAGVVENRLGEGGIVNRQPDLVAILLSNDAQLDRTAEKVARLTGPGTNIGAAAIFVDVDQGWEIATLIAPDGNGLEAKVQSLVPGGLGSATRGPRRRGLAACIDRAVQAGARLPASAGPESESRA